MKQKNKSNAYTDVCMHMHMAHPLRTRFIPQYCPRTVHAQLTLEAACREDRAGVASALGTRLWLVGWLASWLAWED